MRLFSFNFVSLGDLHIFFILSTLRKTRDNIQLNNLSVDSFFHFSLYVEKGEGEFSIVCVVVIEYNNQSRCERLSQMNLFTVANCSIQYIYISIIQHQYNWACSTGHNIKSIHKLSVKKINTLFFNQTLVTQNELSVADASRTPRGCGFDVLECQKG